MKSMPPTAIPMMKHITRFQEKPGIAPQIVLAVAIQACLPAVIMTVGSGGRE